MSRAVMAELRRWYREDAAVPLPVRLLVWAVVAVGFAALAATKENPGLLTALITGGVETGWTSMLLAGVVGDYRGARVRVEGASR